MRADCNRWVGAIEIRPDHTRVRRDVPLHSDVEVKISLDVSRNSSVEVFIPILDEVFTTEFSMYTETRSPGELKKELSAEMNRFTELNDRARRSGDARTNAILEQMEREQIVETVQRQVAAAQGDPAAKIEADKKLLYLRNLNYAVEDTLRWPDLEQEARARLGEARQIVESHGYPGEKQARKELAPKIESAIQAQPFDLEALRAAVRQLIRLLPEGPVAIDTRGRYAGTIILA